MTYLSSEIFSPDPFAFKLEDFCVNCICCKCYINWWQSNMLKVRVVKCVDDTCVLSYSQHSLY